MGAVQQQPHELVSEGGDEELSLRNSAKEQFPYLMEVLCALHLEDNTKRHLAENNVPEAEKKRFTWKIYNKRDGLVVSKNEIEFRKRALDISEKAVTHLSEEKWETLQVKIWQHVVVPRIVCPQIPLAWKVRKRGHP